jgi:hypothetical protein
VPESPTGAIEAPDSWAVEHDRLPYGIPKGTGKGLPPE